jgi:hypothetical protein
METKVNGIYIMIKGRVPNLGVVLFTANFSPHNIDTTFDSNYISLLGTGPIKSPND